MALKRSRKATFALLRSLPKRMRDHICRARLNILPLSDDIAFEVARTPADLDQAFQILHDAHVKEGTGKPQPSRRRISDHHALPSTSTLVAKVNRQVVATLSIIRDGPFGLPIEAALDLALLRKRGERIGEVSALAVRPDFRGRSSEVLFYLFKFLYRYSIDCLGLDRFVIVVTPDWIPLYESVLLFKRMHPPAIRSHAFANAAPAVCASLNLNRAAGAWRQVYGAKPVHKNIHRFLRGNLSQTEKRRMHFPERPFYTAWDPVMTPELLDYFFNRCTAALGRFAAERMRVLQTIYDHEGYAPVWPQRQHRGCRNHRKDRRFDVACRGLMQGPSRTLAKLNVREASRRGLRVCAATAGSGSAVRVLHIAVGRNKTVRIKARARWRSGRVCGMEILQAGRNWEHFVDFLERQIPARAAALCRAVATAE